MTGSINKKNRVGLWTQKLKIDLSNTVNKADTEFNDFIHSCFDTEVSPGGVLPYKGDGGAR